LYLPTDTSRSVIVGVRCVLLCDNDHEIWYLAGFLGVYYHHPRPCKKRPVSRVKVFIHLHLAEWLSSPSDKTKKIFDMKEPISTHTDLLYTGSVQ